MVGPGMMLWAPREFELFRLADGGQGEQLLWHYLRRAPVAEAFLWRRWLYLLWDEVENLVMQTMQQHWMQKQKRVQKHRVTLTGSK